MKEKIKITGHGILHEEDFGDIKIDKMSEWERGLSLLHDLSCQQKQSVIYDKKIDQYCVDGQWEIPFHQHQKDDILSIENKLKKFFFEIKDIKSNFTDKQMFEAAAAARDVEKSILFLIQELKRKDK